LDVADDPALLESMQPAEARAMTTTAEARRRIALRRGSRTFGSHDVRQSSSRTWLLKARRRERPGDESQAGCGYWISADQPAIGPFLDRQAGDIRLIDVEPRKFPIPGWGSAFSGSP
jgi:hypothetical protein